MTNTLDPDPTPFGLSRATAIPAQTFVRAVNLTVGLALLSDDTVVPITRGFDRDGEECGLQAKGLAFFVCGSDGTGWFDCRADGFDWTARQH